MVSLNAVDRRLILIPREIDWESVIFWSLDEGK
jgi:hypothetical protein